MILELSLVNISPLLVEGFGVRWQKEGASFLIQAHPLSTVYCSVWQLAVACRTHNSAHLQVPAYIFLSTSLGLVIIDQLWPTGNPANFTTVQKAATIPSPKRSESRLWETGLSSSIFFPSVLFTSPIISFKILFHLFIVANSLEIDNVSFLISYLLKLLSGFFLLNRSWMIQNTI